MKTDIELQRDVIAALAQDASVRDENIGTAVHDGVVTLSGTVDDYEQRRAAETAAARVAGVRALVQSIAVHAPIDADPADADIARHVVQALRRAAGVPDEDIHVRVENGWVGLTGTVARERERMAAESAIANIVGIRGIRNLVEVRPHTPTRDVAARITTPRYSAEVDGDYILVREIIL